MEHLSASNTFFGSITTILATPILAEITIRVQNGHDLVSVVTSESFTGLGLAEGASVLAMVKAPDILISKRCPQATTSARNVFPGTIRELLPHGAVVEIAGVLDDGTPMSAMATIESVAELDLQPGNAVWFFFKSFSVILISQPTHTE